MGKQGDFKGWLGGAARLVRGWQARPGAKLASLTKTVLVSGAVLGLVQPTFALGIDPGATQGVFPTSQGVYASLLQLDGVGASAAQSVGTDEAVFSELKGFANTVAPAVTSSARRTQVADADSLVDFLKGNSKPAPVAPAAPVAKGVAVKAPVLDAHIVGDKVCVTCHAGHAEAFSKTLMGRINKTQPGKFACENCHGPGSVHVKLGGGRGVGGIISFRSEDQSRTAEENNAICLACHEKGDRTYWQGSMHQNRDLQCSNCHTIMKSVSAKYQLRTVNEMDTCFQCHKDRRAQLYRSSHMPLREGKMVCSDCHNPHGSTTESLLKADSINDVCYKCHAEKRGPFLFEHAPVRENCLNCHDPHGSVNEYSLKVSRPRLCFECHGFGHGSTNGPNSQFTMGRSCQNCHTQVHGSNSPAGGAFHR